MAPVNILWIDLYYFSRNSMSTSLRRLLFYSILSQVVGCFMKMTPTVRLPPEVHRSAKYLNALQLAFKNENVLLKLKIIRCYETVHTNKIVNISVGPLAAVTSKSVAEVNILAFNTN